MDSSGRTARVLIVEDDEEIAGVLGRTLRLEDYETRIARDGQGALAEARTYMPDVVVLDLGLPDIDGIEVAERLRESGDVPILILTARDAVEHRVEGLDSGADDYLVKPFDLDELAARLRALLRRRSGRATPLIENDPLTLDPASHEVRLDGAAINLSAREFGVLHALLESPGVPLSRAQLEDRLYGWEQEIGSNAVEVHIHALRRKLGSDWIRNVRGVGYMVPRQP